MNKVTLLFLLLFAAVLAQCFPVTASQGGNRSARLFFCNVSGCADDVTSVYCTDDVDLLTHTRITDCTGPPQPNTVCRHDGRAFVSSDTHGYCDFEGKSGYIVAEKCTDHSNICAFMSANASSQVTTEDHARHRYIAAGVSGSVLLIILIFGIRSCRIAQIRKSIQQLRDNTNVQLGEMESPKETSDSDTPGLDDGCSPSHRDRGA
ncbi:hypothetical protein VZT92_019112 [Zoarces viviparus]|uniref:Uncharacterized protein n=1 Tax=Zoarces viviparus TaxID=48416 RepID=A0AAW1EKD8_ZOAVI